VSRRFRKNAEWIGGISWLWQGHESQVPNLVVHFASWCISQPPTLPGHAEGAGRYINFSFGSLVAEPYCLFLYVHAWGPWSLTAEVTRDSGLAESVWASYANNIANAINDGTIVNY
jgi:hypothetical protein